MFKTIEAFPDLCRSSTVRPESWRCRHERVTDISRFITISQIMDDRDERSGQCDWGFSLKIWHLVATILMIFLRINMSNVMQFKQY